MRSLGKNERMYESPGRLDMARALTLDPPDNYHQSEAVGGGGGWGMCRSLVVGSQHMSHSYAPLRLTCIRGCVANTVSGLYLFSVKDEARSNSWHSVLE
jgi:hypothetical protein